MFMTEKENALSLAKLMSIYAPLVAVLGAAAYIAATVFGIHPGEGEPAE